MVIHFPHALRVAAVFIAALALAAISTGGPHALNAAPPHETVNGSMQGADPEAKPDEVLVRLRLPATSVTAVSVARSVGATVSEVKSRSGVIILNLPEAQIDNALERLKRNPLVQQAGRNLLARVAAAPDDPGYPAQWHLHDTEGGIFAESAWDLAPNLGTGVIIAIIDTGMAYESYIDPSGRVFTPSPDLAAATFVASWDFQAGDSHANDEHGHGTHMAGTIASSTGNGYGVAGIAPQASIMPLKVLGGNGTGTAADVVESIFYAVDSGARVINMSLGFPGTGAPDASGQYCTEIVGLGAALDYAYTSNVTVVAAAGNDNGPVICPAAYPSAIAVGATRFDGTIAYYSNRGASLDVTAPGGDDRADQNGDGSIDGVLQNSYCSDPSTLRQSGRYDEFCDVFKVGTSSATAHVTGLVALLLGEQSGLTPDQVRSLVQATARDRGLTGWDSDYGWGTIDARAALEALHGGGPPPPPEPTPGPTPAPPPVTPNRSYPPSIQSLDVPFARVIDGDVLEIRVDGVLWGVRYIGVDAPAGNTPCGRQATARNWELTAGGVHLELEAPYDLDAAGLRLYHVSNTAGELIGETLIREGLARVTDEAHQYRDRYLAAEEEARTAGRGCLWSGNAAELQPAPQPVDAPPAVEEGPSIEAIIPVPGFEEVVVASHLSLPTSFDFTPDGRIFIAEQRGVVRVVKDGVLLATPLIDIQSRVNDYWDRGLLGIAVDPDFAANGYVYLLYAYENNANDYTGRKTARLTRVTVIGDQASPASEVVVLGTVVGVSCNDFPVDADCIPSDSPSHSVGNVRFGPDSYMYVTTGDAAHFNFVDGDALRAQDLDLLAGKVLRINRDGTGVPDNPFWNGDPSANRSKVWARGVRNAFRFNVRPTTGTPYLGDVGWNTWEEINIVRKGVNLGWPCYEGVGQQPGYGSDPVCKSLYALGSTAVTSPVYQWENGGGGAAAVGGDFAITYPSPYTDAYFFGDYVRSWIKYLQADANDNVISIQDFTSDGADGPVAFETGLDGEIYYLAINVGELRHIRSTAGNRNPVAVAEAEPTSGLAPLTVTFSSTGSSDPDLDPLAFEWDFGDGSPTSNEAAPEHTYTGNGVYTATLVVRDGQGGESSDTVTITVGNRAPIITISEPLADSIYKTGDTISFVGSAVDPEDGTLPPSSLAWTITLHHNTHTHPFLTATGESGSFVVPDHGDDSFFEIVLTATDNSGLQSSLRVFIRPQEVHLTFDTSPSGLAIIYDGRLLQAPVTVTTIANSVRTIDTPSPQFQGALEYTFTSWSDSGAQKHDINTGVTDATLIASFNATVTSPITFDDIAGQNQVLSGQYPSGIIDWGSSGQWWHSEPWGLFTTKSVTFNGPGITSATFTFATPHRLVRLDAYNGSTTGTTVTLSCPGQPNKQTLLASLQLLTIDTGWAATCSSVTIASSNGWDTNFDNLVVASASPTNQPPDVDAGPNQTITLPAAANLDGTVSDDGLPNPPAAVTVTWSQVSGPGTVTFADASAVDTTASFSASGTYILRLTASDSALQASDDVTISVNSPQPDNQPPTVVTPASASPNPVAGTVTSLSVLGDDDGGEANLTYTWATSGTPPAPVTFSANATNASKTTTATFTRAGSYTFQVIITDGGGLTVTSTVTVTVGQTLTSISVAPASASVAVNATQQFVATARDQFDTALASQPSFVWNVSGGGTISGSGLFTAGTAAGGPFTVTASSGGQSGTASVTVVPATQTITFDDISGQNQPLTGQYPSGVIDWGSSGQWWHSEPWGLFTTKSVTFNGPGITSATFTFATPHRLVRLDAYNGSTTGTTVTLSCPGQPNKQTLLASLQLLTIDTGWAATCSSVTIASSNGWDTNFDNLVIASAPGEPDTTPPAISNVAAQSITSSSAQIVWQTNEPATSQVEWGTDTNYGNTTSLDSTLVTQHSQTIISLAPEQTYHYRVLSRDAAGNASVSPDFMFTTPASAPTTRTITFDDIAGQNQVLSGQYPSGVIDWGSSGQWWHSEPWGLFTTKSVTFNGPGITSATFTFATPHRLVRLDAYNGGSRSTTVTLSCPGQPNKQVTVNARRLLTIDTGWAATCSSVTIASSNGWNTNFDNLVVAGAPGASSTTPLATSTDADSNSSARSSPTSTTASSDNDMKAQLGEWSPLLPWPIVAVHAALLPNGKVLMWDAWEFGVTTGKLWDPGTNSFTDVDIDSQLFCSGHVFLADGRLLVAGGHDGGEVGIEDAYVFSYASQGWSRLPDMHVARWYPTTTTLGDGRVVAFSGQITHDVFADVPEIYDPATNTWSILNVDTSSMHDHEYPLNFLLPNGQIYSIGATPGVAGILDVVSPAWTDMGAIPKRFGSAVMYRPGKVLYSGGGIERGQPATNEAFVLDLTQGGAAWEQTSSMGHPRYQHNLVMLPDGKVIAIGGAQSVQQDAATGTLAVEVWDPTTGTWTTMASMADPRNYHSVALLLPDGRVLSAGGGRPHGASSPPAYLSAQIYSPPYLFKGARPIITTAPDVSAYGASITVETPDAADIVAVSLISLPSVTHSLDMNQHYLELSFVPGLNEVRVTLPANQNLAPPGYYMLFLINSQGVPSVAHTMRISAPDANTPIPSGVSAQNVTSGTPIVWQTDDPALSQVEG